MPHIYIDIIDTAVKIGLGASISGITAYFITKSNNNHEKSKELINRRLNTIEFITEDLSNYFNNFSTLLSDISGVIKISEENASITDKGLDFIYKADAKYTASRELKNKAISRLELLGLEDTIKTLKRADNLDVIVRDKVIFNKILPTSKEHLEWGIELQDIRKQAFQSLSTHYSE